MYKPNIEVHWRIHCRRGKALSTALHILGVSVALAVQHVCDIRGASRK